MAIELIPIVIILAFVLEFFDSAVGMGYGTTITSTLLLLGFAPLRVIPSVLFTNMILGITAALFHHGFKNVNFHPKSRDLKVTMFLFAFGLIGVIIAVIVAIRLPENVLRTYIGCLVLVIGIFVLLTRHHKIKFSWKGLVGFGTLAAFNKGMTAGGYGSVLVGGQMLSGIEGKKAIGVAVLTEGLLSLVAVLGYHFINGGIDVNWSLVISLLIGGLLSLPIAAYVVKKFHPKRLRFTIGIVNIILGTAILTRFVL